MGGMEVVGRFCLLQAAKDTEYVTKAYGGYFNVFVSAFGEEGEEWDVFRVVDGDFPKEDVLENYDGFVVSGSPHDSYADHAWILHLCLLLQKLYSMQKKLLGICFGHQQLIPWTSNFVYVPSGWSGRLWGRSLCSCDTADKFTCESGDRSSSTVECSGGGAAPPTSLAEFTLNGVGDLDYYDVSFVNKHNIPMMLAPAGGNGGNCTTTGCGVDLNAGCPAELRVVLCRALGGKVGKAYTGWDIGLRNVRILKNFSPCAFLDNLPLQDQHQTPPSLSIIECHQDEVWEVPSGAQVIAYSDKTGVEMFTMGEHMLGIQGHPEYTNDILYHLIDRLLDTGCIEKGYAEEVKSKLEKVEPDRKCWQRICKAFLKGRFHS